MFYLNSLICHSIIDIYIAKPVEQQRRMLDKRLMWVCAAFSLSSGYMYRTFGLSFSLRRVMRLFVSFRLINIQLKVAPSL